METEPKPTFLKEVCLFYGSNNMAHHTDQITVTKLIVRRGQGFIMSIRLNGAFNPSVNPLTITAQTGEHPSEDLGTMSSFSIPDNVGRTSSAKVAWKADLQSNSPIKRGVLTVFITPPANCPVGKYKLLAKYKGEEAHLADLVILFNPWSPEDTVYLAFEKKKKEYVLNEQGVIYKGSANYITSMDWDFGQFEEDMVDICMTILDKSLSYKKDPAGDVAKRADPIHVSRVLSAMVNSLEDQGIVEGNWSGYYDDGFAPGHWTGSHAILSKWYKSEFKPVKYGQCRVFAGVLCSVMRLLGIPSRVITNFTSAYDVDSNMVVDMIYSENGLVERERNDCIWINHVWVEGWFKRPDLSKKGEFDGWQVVDSTPQGYSDGLSRCGPASVKAIKQGRTDLKFDTPFVFAEVNADCIDWVVIGEDETEREKIDSNTKRIGQNISTKAVGSKHRRDVTDHYKFKEGSSEERVAFWTAVNRDYTRVDESASDEEENSEPEEVDNPKETPVVETPPPELTIRFEEATQPVNGKDVSMILVLHSESTVPRDLTINISVQAMKYNGVLSGNIQSEKISKTLLPGQELSFPIVVPYSVYHKHMVKSESMKIDAVVSEKDVPDHKYLAECDVVLLEPEVTVTVNEEVKMFRRAMAEVIFENPVEEMLTDCVLTVSGSGLLKDDFECKLPDLSSDNRFRVKVYFVPYKMGERNLLVDFDCSEFRDIKASAAITVIA